MKRILSPLELENLIDFIKPAPHIPADIADSIVKMHKNRLISQLANLEMYPEILPELKSILEEQFQTSLIQVGESVGILCSQSIGEEQTQSTLNAFHHSGISNAITTKGIPRFEELLNATKNPKVINHTVHFVSDIGKSIKNLRKHLGSTIKGFMLGDLSISMKIYLEKEREEWYDIFEEIYGITDLNLIGKNCVQVILDKRKLFEYSITLKQICSVLTENYIDFYCIWSPPSVATIDIYVKTDKIVLNEKKILYITEENKISVYLQEVVLPNLHEIHICGILGIEEVFYRKDSESDRWIIDTTAKIPKLNNSYCSLLGHPLVDYQKTLSNNVWDIYNILDIEAAREFLIQEFVSIMNGINLCHCILLVDRMTYNGSISSINRYTLKKDEPSPFTRASFEETMDNFVNAAERGECDQTKGVSASIICGKKPNIGTGMSTLMVDMDAIKEIPDPNEKINTELNSDTDSENELVLVSKPRATSSLLSKNYDNYQIGAF